MTEQSIINSRYKYEHESAKAVDIHHIITKRRQQWIILACISALVLLLNAFYLISSLDIHLSVPLIYLIFGVALIKLLRGKIVEKESIMIISEMGVQLETHYRSGRAVHRFVPIDKILKPLLNECVTPVTCYWSLALLLRDEDELMLVFQELQPPLKMLLPIWKALCDAINSREGLES